MWGKTAVSPDIWSILSSRLIRATRARSPVSASAGGRGQVLASESHSTGMGLELDDITVTLLAWQYQRLRADYSFAALKVGDIIEQSPYRGIMWQGGQHVA